MSDLFAAVTVDAVPPGEPGRAGAGAGCARPAAGAADRGTATPTENQRSAGGAFRGARGGLRTVAGIAALAVLALGVTGCHSGSGTAGASGASPAPKATSAQPAPKDVLLAATAKLAKTRYKFTFSDSCGTSSGVVDPQRKSFRVDDTYPTEPHTTIVLSLLSVNSQAWFKSNDPGLPPAGKWLHLDPAKMKGSTQLAEMREFGGPAGPAGEVFGSIRDAQKAGDDTYTGRFDVSKATTRVGQSCLGADFLPSKAKFKARPDAQGRLAKLTINVPYSMGGPDTTKVIEYSDYGSAEEPQQPPANQVVEAPAETYE